MNRALLGLLCWLAAAAAARSAGDGTGPLVKNDAKYPSHLKVTSRPLGAEPGNHPPGRRVKRKIKPGVGHVIDSFHMIPEMGLNVAVQIVSNVTAKSPWALRARTTTRRPVRKLGGLFFILLTQGAGSHAIDVKENQIRVLEDPLDPRFVLSDQGPQPTSSPPVTTATPPHTGVTPSVTTAPPTISTVAPPTPPTTPAEPSYTFDFPEECGTRPTFGLSDNVRLLAPRQEQTRVIGGAPVASGSYPWQAQIEIAVNRGYQHSCGGIVISPNLILSAAHCHTKNENNYQVRVAQHNLGGADPFERIFAVQQTHKHFLYRSENLAGQRNDIALFKLKFPIGAPQALMFNDYVQPLCLPTVNTTLFVGQECHISGWGLVDPNQSDKDEPSGVLRGAIINILDPAICKRAYRRSFDERLMVCAGREEGGVDTCQGDSGGPLSCRDETGQWFAAGVVSFGWKCGQAGNPGVYTRVSAYLEWTHRTAAFLTGGIII
ncbi:chymotrypsin-like elastase family member 2A [Pollicipes pollicipes]|uniref:chymotrypsin-like elastase family member 2A n=1 Tax=Pollicipes pollicipes TaxID=41117 RepID=UPI0018855326|nr:chymotrypsin-like elastase family member 2A [Pollicipes pollicipes]